jgi:hypothetical protein
MIKNAIPEDQINKFIELFDYIFKGNQYAIELCLNVITVFHVWDDIFDGDMVTGQTVNAAFRHLIDDIPMNPVMMNNTTILYPTLFNVYSQWIAANEFESAKEEFLIDKSYMLRAGVYQFFVMVAKCLYGNEWAEHVSPIVFDSYAEKLDDLKKEILDA